MILVCGLSYLDIPVLILLLSLLANHALWLQGRSSCGQLTKRRKRRPRPKDERFWLIHHIPDWLPDSLPDWSFMSFD